MNLVEKVVESVLQSLRSLTENAFWLFQRHFVEAHVDDGLLEIFGLKQGWHASFVMFELISAKHIAQVLYILF